MKLFPSHLLKNYLLSFTGLPRACWHGIFLSFVESALGGICFFLSLYFVNVLHIDIATSGFIISAYGIGRIVGGFFGGKLTDEFSAHKVSVWSLLLQGLVFLILIKTKNIFGLGIILFLLGATAYGFITSNNVWVLEQCEKNERQRLKSINLLYTSSNLGLGVAALITAIFAAYSFKWLFLFSGILFVVQSFFLALKKQESNVINLLNEAQMTNMLPKKKNKEVIFVMLACLFLISLVVSQRNTTFLVFIHDTFPHLGYVGTSFLFALNPLLIVLFQTPLVACFEDFNKILMVGMSTFLMGIGTLLLVFTHRFFSIPVISCIIYTIGEMFFFSLVQLVIYERISEGKKGTGFGLYKTIYGLSTMVGPALGGVIYDQFGASMVWYLSGLLGIICLLACLLYQQYN
jgi:MFS family permease